MGVGGPLRCRLVRIPRNPNLPLSPSAEPPIGFSLFNQKNEPPPAPFHSPEGNKRIIMPPPNNPPRAATLLLRTLTTATAIGIITLSSLAPSPPPLSSFSLLSHPLDVVPAILALVTSALALPAWLAQKSRGGSYGFHMSSLSLPDILPLPAAKLSANDGMGGMAMWVEGIDSLQS